MLYKANTIPWEEAMRRRQEQLIEGGGVTMDRMKQIMERIRTYHYFNQNEDAQDDMFYLLSKLEIAEKALEKIEQETAASWIADEATEALQQIRE